MLLKNATLNGIQQKNEFRENLLKVNVRKTNMMVTFDQWRKKKEIGKQLVIPNMVCM